jgi:hypothetical protein
LADGWYDLAEKEKSPLRKSQLQAHAKFVYESALADAPSLIRAKIDKRLEALESAGSPGVRVDLLRTIDLNLDAIKGQWTKEGRSIVSGLGAYERVQAPYEPPEEFDLLLQCKKKQGQGIIIGLGNRGRGTVNLDGWGNTVSGLDMIDSKRADANETSVRGSLFVPEKSTQVAISVRKTGVSVVFDGRKIIEWKGAPTRLGET